MQSEQALRTPLQSTLLALFEGTRRGRPEAGALARRLGSSPTCVARALVELEARGLADASRARLTMRGLAVASALQARGDTRALPPVQQDRASDRPVETLRRPSSPPLAARV